MTPAEKKIRKGLADIEAKLATTDNSTLDNCDLHVRYWSMREALASIALGNLEAPPGDRKANYTLLRQASEHCAMWEQRRAAARRDAHLDKLAELEQKMNDIRSAASAIGKIATNGPPKKRKRKAK